MRKILISACLLGEPCRYDGSSKRVSDPRISEWEREQRLIPVCPEILGGLPVPRTPCERSSACWDVKSASGEDFTRQFYKGGAATLALARQHNVICCILKEASPSCGSNLIYDGTFSGKKIKGMGVATEYLIEAGFLVFSENELDKAQKLVIDADSDE